MGGVEKEWPLDVYRCSTTRGWEKQIPVHVTDEQHNLKPHATGIPKEGCILVKRFRLKISLACRTDGGDDQEEKGARPSQNSRDLSREVIRRNNCLLLTSKKRFRAILLKFPSVRDCLEFSDQLLLLNHSLPFLVEPTNKSNASAVIGNASSLAGHKEMMQGTSLPRQPPPAIITPASSFHSDNALSIKLQMNDMFCHIVRLLHDDSVRNYVGQIEQFIHAFPDGKHILQALLTLQGKDASCVTP